MKLKESTKIAVSLRDNGDKNSMALLYKAHFNNLERFITKNFKDIPLKHIHDLASDSIIRSFDKIHQFDETKSNYVTWLYTIAYNDGKRFFNRDPEHTREFLIPNESFELLGLNKSITGNKHKTFVKSTMVYDTGKHPLDSSEEEFNNFNQKEVKERSSKILEIIGDISNDLNRKIAEDYFVNDCDFEYLTNKYDIPEGTIKSRIRKIRNKTLKTYKTFYTSDINEAKRNRDLNKTRELRKVKREKLEKIISEIDLEKVLFDSDITVLAKNVYKEYRINNKSRSKVKEMFDLNHIDKVNSYCDSFNNYLLKNFN